MSTLSTKEAFDLYENGKHRRYSLLFSVNGGAFAIAKLLAGGPGTDPVVLGHLTLRPLRHRYGTLYRRHGRGHLRVRREDANHPPRRSICMARKGSALLLGPSPVCRMAPRRVPCLGRTLTAREVERR